MTTTEPRHSDQKDGGVGTVVVLDTCVLLADPDSLYAFGDADIIIPLTVIEELDTFKRSNDERGRSARFVSRKLDELRKHGKLSDWVPLEHGGKLKVEIQVSDGLPKAFSAHKAWSQSCST